MFHRAMRAPQVSPPHGRKRACLGRRDRMRDPSPQPGGMGLRKISGPTRDLEKFGHWRWPTRGQAGGGLQVGCPGAVCKICIWQARKQTRASQMMQSSYTTGGLDSNQLSWSGSVSGPVPANAHKLLGRACLPNLRALQPTRCRQAQLAV